MSNLCTHCMPRSRPLSADFTSTTSKSTILFSVLPSAVRSRLPRLPSLRQSVSMYGFPSKRSCRSTPGSGRNTPSEHDRALVLSGDREMMDYFSDAETEREQNRLMGMGSAGSLEMEEKKSGIDWKFASQGLSLLSLSVEESTSLSANPTCGSAPFARQLYIHALSYLLRGLPSDLSPDEQLSVHSSLPGGIVKPLQVQVSSSAHPAYISVRSRSQPSLLHRTLSTTIVQLFVLTQLLMPYLQTLLRAAHKYEREHKVSEKVLATGIDVVDAVGRKSINVGSVIWGLGIGEAVAWVIEGVSGGISEGVGEGLMIVGSRR